MKQLVLLACLAGVSAASGLAADDWKDTLEDALKAGVQFTKFGSHGSLSTIGSKYALKVENIQAMPTDGFTSNSNVVENGVRKEARLGQRAITGLLNASTRRTQGMQIEPGTAVGIVKIRVGKETVAYQIVTLKQEKITLKGNTESQYLYTWLQFPFKDLENLDAAAVQSAVYAALVPERSAPGAGPAPPAQPTATTSSAVPQTPTSAPGRAALATEVTPGNDLIGKTTAELIAILGSNYTMVTVGDRTIYVFPDLGIRVPVVGGRVVSGR